jgi:hypothetical protein
MSEWKLVPVRPTDEMLDAADVPARVHPDAYFRAVYRAMLAAAPEPPADPRDGEIARLRKWNESVAVCREHVDSVTAGGCLVCENERLRERVKLAYLEGHTDGRDPDASSAERDWKTSEVNRELHGESGDE